MFKYESILCERKLMIDQLTLNINKVNKLIPFYNIEYNVKCTCMSY